MPEYHILVVDDSATLRAHLVRLLNDTFGPVEVSAAADGTSALDLFRQQVWDVVILDISMPGENGLMVLNHLRRLQPTQPVVMLSVSVDRATVADSFRRGALAFVAKEDTADELAPAIRSALAGQPYRSQRVTRDRSHAQPKSDSP